MSGSVSASSSDGQLSKRCSPMRSLGFLTLGVGLLLPLLAGCPGSLEGTFPPPGGGGTGGTGAGGAAGVCDAPTMVFATRCSFCHPLLAQPDLTMNPPPDLTVVMSTMASTGCVGMPLVNATTPADSVLLKRISGTTCGDQMPMGGPYLSATEIACVTSWVMSKAQ
jgi:hypothetical protein